MRWIPGLFVVLPLAASVGLACQAEEVVDDGETNIDAYTTEGTCDGLPRVKVTTPPGVCVGLVYQAPSKKVTNPQTGKVKTVFSGLVRPRGIGQLPDGDLVVADMGGWASDIGGVWRLHREANKAFTAKQIFEKWDKPSGIQVDKNGLVYVGTPANIVRFDPKDTSFNGRPRVKLVIGAFKASDPGALPSDGRHPLRAFVFDKKDPSTMFVNIGSFSDVCEAKTGFTDTCAEADGADPRGAIRKYKIDGTLPLKSQDGEIIARGLRNSMALEVHPKGLLMQGENSRDVIDLRAPDLDDWELPHEELNVIEPGAHYGWPYCFDNNVPNPEYRGKVDCAKFAKPTMLLPAHASPLGMRYYFPPAAVVGKTFPESYVGQLIVGYHSGHENGHRLAMIPTDADGRPSGPAKDLIRGWETKANGDPRGAPVDVLVAQDGSIYLTEDLNHTVLRVVWDKSVGNGEPLATQTIKKPVLAPEVQARCDDLKKRNDPLALFEKQVIDNACARSTCHGRASGPPGNFPLLMCDAEENAKRLLGPQDKGGPLVVPGDERSHLVKLINGEEGLPQMPAGGLSPEQMEFVIEWIRAGAPSKLK